MADEAPQPSRKERRKFTVNEEVEAVLEKHGYADWAIVCRAVDGSVRSWWTAGDGQNPVGDDERGMILLGKMAALQRSILDHFAPKNAPP